MRSSLPTGPKPPCACTSEHTLKVHSERATPPCHRMRPSSERKAAQSAHTTLTIIPPWKIAWCETRAQSGAADSSWRAG
eukprot:3189129-Prymnesium_polylepis.2